jgi:copper(I)-binding protein
LQSQNASEDSIMLGEHGSPGMRRGPTSGRPTGLVRVAAVVRTAVVRTAVVRAADVVRTAVVRAAAAVVTALGIACVAVTGCAQRAAADPSIRLGTAYVEVPTRQDITDAYLVIQNNGAADRLISARTSVGGRVTFQAPTRPGSASTRTVRDIAIPSQATVRLVPDGSYLVITGAGPMHAGRQIQLTLVFAKAGAMSVAAEVTNLATGGGSYLSN